MNQQQIATEVLVESVTEPSLEQSKLRDAYVKERTYLEVVEIELNRSKIIMIDEQGRKKRIAILSEH
jgi:ABC-type phosphate transport system auxiliary subunit